MKTDKHFKPLKDSALLRNTEFVMHAAFLLALLIFPTKFRLDNYSGMTGATMKWAEYVTDVGHETNTGLRLSALEEKRPPL